MAGIVSSGHPDTSAAVAEILADGGNAFDAAVAGLLTACAVEPFLASLGGGGFLMAEISGGERRLYDFFAETPGKRGAEDRIYPIHGDFGAATQEFHIGAGSMAVPGMVDGLFTVHRDLGRLPLKRLVEPAVRHARHGVTVNAFQAKIASILEPICRSGPEIEALFVDEGRLLGEGDAQTQPDLADALEALAAEGPALFYRGELAGSIENLCRDRGGHLRREDLSAYRTKVRKPLTVTYRQAEIATNPIPSCGGTLIAHSLRLLDGLRRWDWRREPQAYQRILPRIQAATQLARLRSALQQRNCEETARELLADDSIEQLLAHIEEHVAVTRGTTQLSIIDGDGNIASSTVSNGEGSGCIVPGSGIHMNNFLGEQDLMPEGIGAWTPGRRMASMMAPSIVRTGEGGRIALGSGGSNRLRTAILQVLMQLLEFERSLADAVHAPRMHLENEQLSLEPGFDDALIEALRADYPTLELWTEQNLFFGGVNAVMRLADGRLEGAGDPRRGGDSRLA